MSANVLFLLLLLHEPSCSICLVKLYLSDFSQPFAENLAGCITHCAVQNLIGFITGFRKNIAGNYRVNNVMRMYCGRAEYLTVTLS